MSRKIETLTISAIERERNSVNGNPRYRVSFAGTGTGDDYQPGPVALTSSDAGCAYEIGNPGYRVGDTVRVEFTKAGRIACLWAAEPESRDLTEQDKAVSYQLEAKVYVAQRFTLWPDCPEDLEAEDATTIGVYSSQEAAEQAMAEDGAELWAELDGEDEDEKPSFMAEYRWAVDAQSVLS